MAQTEEIILKTTIDTGNSTESIKSLKTQLRETTTALGSLEKGSAAFEAARKKAGQLKEQIRGVNDAIEDADPEKKFAMFGRAIQGAAGAFTGLQGAMALFGNESKDLEKTLLKVQGAMAFSQGLNSVLEFKNDFADLAKTIGTKVVQAFTTLKGAIAATGLGLLVVTIGAIATNWGKFSEVLSESIPGFDSIVNFFKNFRQIAVGSIKAAVESFRVIGEVVAKFFSGDFGEAIDAAKSFGSRVAEAYNEGYEEEDKKVKIENSLKSRKLQLDIEEAKGKDILAKRLKFLQDELFLLKKGSDEYNAKLIEIEGVRKQIRDKAADERVKSLENTLNLLKAKEVKYIGDFDKIQTAEKNILKQKLKDGLIKQKEYDNGIQLLNIARDKYVQDSDKKRQESIKQAQEEDRQNRINTLNLDFADTKLSGEKRLEALKQLQEQGLQLDVDANQFKEELRIKDLQNQQMIANASMQGLSDLASAMGANAETMKAIAVAQTTIDTYYAAQIAYKQASLNPATIAFPAYPYIMAGAAIASGLARVAAIARTNPKGSGGGNVPSGGGGAAPSAPMIAPASNATRLTNGNEPVITRSLDVKNNRVYVLEKDITSTQGRVDNIRNQATVQ
jgi:hypothetical protein